MLGVHEIHLAYLLNHREEMSMKQKGMEDEGGQKGLTRAASTQAWPKTIAEGAHRNCSGQAGPMAGGDCLWVDLDCHRAELEVGHAG